MKEQRIEDREKLHLTTQPLLVGRCAPSSGFATLAMLASLTHIAPARVSSLRSDTLLWAGATSAAGDVRRNIKCILRALAARPGLRPSGASNDGIDI